MSNSFAPFSPRLTTGIADSHSGQVPQSPFVSHLLTTFIALMVVAFAPLAAAAPVLKYKVIETQDHDPQLFTQGLIVSGDTIIESSGLYQKSLVRVYNASTGQIIANQSLSPEIFAEGITRLDDALYLLTWRAGILFVLDANTLRTRKTKRYRGEGWGITHNGEAFFTTDGSNTITQRSLDTFKPEQTLAVVHNGQPLDRLNELEFADGALWANRWQTPYIYRINPANGTVTGELDLTDLIAPEQSHSMQEVLNGIAYDPVRKAYWVTGKYWDTRYLIEIKD